MTQNQIKYWSYKEDQRHNRAIESVQDRTLAESIRHNQQTELLGFKTLEETTRHNQAQESIGWGQIQLGYANLSETQRHNRATETAQIMNIEELSRHNLAMEKQSSLNWLVDVGKLKTQERQTDIAEIEEQRKIADTAIKHVGNAISFLMEQPVKAIDAIIPG